MSYYKVLLWSFVPRCPRNPEFPGADLLLVNHSATKKRGRRFRKGRGKSILGYLPERFLWCGMSVFWNALPLSLYG